MTIGLKSSVGALLFCFLLTASDNSSLTISLKEALDRAAKYSPQIQTATIAAQLAKEDKAQAKAATLPTVSALNQFIYTEGNGTPSGVFIANDGVHVYNEQLVVHEELLSFLRRGELRVAAAAEAVARAKVDVAARGLRLTVIQDYYTIAVAQRKAANAQSSLNEAQQFLDTAQKLEQGGEVAHADVIKAQLQVQQRQRDMEDALLNFEKAKVNLGVLIFPSLSVAFGIEDDLDQVTALPDMPDVVSRAKIGSPDLHAAEATVKEAKLSVSVARYGYLPSFGLDFFYGLDSNVLAAQSSGLDTGRSTLPSYFVQNRQNLGYSAEATLTVPLWNWGATRSKVTQATLKERQAELDLNMTQKQLQADVTTAYQEAETAFKQVESLRASSELSGESLHLTVLRYQAGEATAFEVVDAQTTAAQARNAYADGLLRYRVATGTLQSLVGTF